MATLPKPTTIMLCSYCNDVTLVETDILGRFCGRCHMEVE